MLVLRTEGWSRFTTVGQLFHKAYHEIDGFFMAIDWQLGQRTLLFHLLRPFASALPAPLHWPLLSLLVPEAFLCKVSCPSLFSLHSPKNHFCELKNACFLTLKLKFLTSLPFTLSLLTPLKITANWNLYFIRLHAVKTSDLNPNHSGQHPQAPAPLLLYCVYLAMF